MKILTQGRTLLSTCALMAGMASVAHAGEVLVNSDIVVSTTWTKNNSYNLQQQIYVTNGATLTIEAGTIIASDTGIGGGLAITRGSRIVAEGTQDEPIIFTSKADVATWTGTVMVPFTPGDPKTGTWREAANEWANLTIMGRAYVSENIIPANTPAPNANNFAIMEGLTEAFPGDPRVLYGGGDDEDDSGTLSYVSSRYTGRVIGLGNELNGISLGGIGRGTDLSHLEVMNNVDDGIEIWGGTVNIKYFSIWNIGDDSLDVDQGWRGKGQFGLIVQGHCLDAPSGSGVPDNMIEADGAEQSDYQPVTTVALYNMTLIGQPAGGDHATAWRDNARLQIRNSIFMDTGKNVVNLDNVDGDGGAGYGHNGTLSWAATWATDYNAVPAHPNDAAPGLAGWAGYPAQASGKLAQITDSVFFRNLFASAYTEANAVNVFAAANNNVLIPGFDAADAPIRSITRGPAVIKGGRTMLPVIGLDPRAANEATTSVGTAPADGFFTPAAYRGAFAPNEQSWLCGWTASFAFGYTTECEPGLAFCFGDGSGTPCPCSNNSPNTGEGCANSTGNGGKLGASGSASVTAGDLVLQGSQLIPGQPGLYFQGNNATAGGNGFGNGDGLRCAGGSIRRLQVRQANPMGNSFTTVNIAAQGNAVPGNVRRYQLWYRNPVGSPCSTTFNLTNGYEIVWAP